MMAVYLCSGVVGLLYVALIIAILVLTLAFGIDLRLGFLIWPWFPLCALICMSAKGMMVWSHHKDVGGSEA